MTRRGWEIPPNPLEVQEDGTPIDTDVGTIDFVGLAVTSVVGGTVQVTDALFGGATADGQTPGAYLGKIVLDKLQTAADTGLLVESAISSITSTTKFVLTTGSDQDDEYGISAIRGESVTRRSRYAHFLQSIVVGCVA